VLSIGKLAASGGGHGRRGVEYYLGRVATGIEDYYTGAGEAPGEWLGSGAAELGLSGKLDATELRAVMDGVDPRSGEALVGGGPGRPRSVPGFDLTFSAPKSVSLLYAFGDPYVRSAVVAAHERAVRAAVADYLEPHAVGARRGTDGVEKLATSGAVAAGFRHRTSRSGDPDLHTHVLVANLVHGADGRWSCIDSALLYTHAKATGACYQAQLRHELTQRLGVEWGPVHNGCADVAGIERSVIVAFSERLREIEAEMARRAETGMRASHVAALATRRAKDYGVTAETLEARWVEQGRAVGFGREDIAHLIDRAEVERPNTRQREAIYDHLASPEGLTERASTYTRRDVVLGLADRLPTGASVRDIERWADAYLASDRAVLLADPLVGHAAGNALRLGSSDDDVTRRLVAVDRDEARYSTPELLATEAQLLATATNSKGAGRGVADEADLERALGRRPSLSEDQRAMVAGLVTSGDGVEVVAAAAGSGKTYALDAAREAWQASGHRVIGAGLAARYAAELEAGSGIASFTVDRMLMDLRNPLDGGFAPGTVVVIDEANTLGTRKLATLLDHAEEAKAKVVLVGDPHQLSEIDAGGAFRGLAVRLGAHELTENHRQRDPWQCDALTELRTGDVEAALASYAEHGAVICAETAGALRQRLVADYLEARGRADDAGRTPSVAMFAPRHADVDDLNRRVRATLAERGELAGPELVVSGRPFAVGDRVMTTRNDRWAGVVNGTRGQVTDLDVEARTLSMRTDAGSEVTLPSRYLDGGHLRHAYATTTHAVEGMTVDAAFFLGDARVYREMGYVAMSRGRDDNRFYVVAPEDLALPERAFGSQDDELLGELAKGLGRSAAKDLALDTAGESGLAARSVADLHAEREAIGERLRRDAPRSPERELSDLASVRRRLEEGLAHARASAERHTALPKRERRQIEREQGLNAPQHRVADWRARIRELDAQEAQLRERGADRRAFFDAHRPDLERYHLLSAVIERREARDIARAVVAPPSYITNALGPRPERHHQREAWTEGVAVIQRHRLRSGITDPERALGAEPRLRDACAAHHQARSDLERANEHLARTGVAHAAQARGRDFGIELSRSLARSR
jgi:conjugative relaxase-like TrwC/TraI family protein